MGTLKNHRGIQDAREFLAIARSEPVFHIVLNDVGPCREECPNGGSHFRLARKSKVFPKMVSPIADKAF